MWELRVESSTSNILGKMGLAISYLAIRQGKKKIFDKFLTFLRSEHLQPTSTRLYAPYENGPHVLGGWEVKFETQEQTLLSRIGIAIGWLMCNRQGFSVLCIQSLGKEGDYEEELKAHQKYSFFLGDMPELDLNFFRIRE